MENLELSLPDHAQERLATLRDFYPQGMESANYFIYKDEYGVKWFYNKIYDTEKSDNSELAKELYFNDDWEGYDDPHDDEDQLTDDNFEVYDKLNEVLTLAYKIEHVDQYLEAGNISSLLNRPENRFKNIIIYSPPNSGKTTALINYLIEANQKFILLLPTALQVNQLSSNDKLRCLTGGISISEKDLPDSPFIVSTYEYFSLYLDSQIIKNQADYYLLVDEFHKIISDSSYRGQSLMHIYQAMFKYLRFIGLTGTPYGCINKELLNHNVVIYKVNVRSPKINIIGRYNIIAFKKRDRHGHSTFATYYQHIKSGLSQGINVIFANNKKLLHKIRDKLLADNVLKRENCIFVTRRERDNPEVQKMIKASEFPNDTKAIFATSILSTGINLEGNNFKNLFICGESNMVEVVQLIFRFRDGIENVYDFIPASNWYGGFFDFEKEVEKETYLYKRIAVNLNKFYRSRLRILEALPDPHTLIKDGFFYLNNNQLLVNENRVRLLVLSKIHEITFMVPARRKEYLELYSLDKQVEIFCDNEEHTVSIKGLSAGTKKFQTEVRDLTIKCINECSRKTLSYFSQKRLINKHLFNNIIINEEIMNLSNEDVDKYDSIFVNCLTHPSVLQVVTDFLFFYGLGLSFDTAVNMTQKNSTFQVIKAIEYMRIFPLTKYSKPEAEDQFSKWIVEQISFVREVHHYLINNKRIPSLKPLGEIIKKLVRPEEFVEHFQKKTVSQLKFIYKITRTGVEEKVYSVGNILTVDKFFHYLKIQASRNDIYSLQKYLNSADVTTWVPTIYKTHYFDK